MENNIALGWTTLEEAKRLVKAGLDPKTADMSYELDTKSPKAVSFVEMEKYYKALYVSPLYEPMTKAYPCWSIGALGGLIPKNVKINDENFHFYMSYNDTNKWSATYETEVFRRTLFCSSYTNQIEMLISVILWLLHNNHIKKQE